MKRTLLLGIVLAAVVAVAAVSARRSVGDAEGSAGLAAGDTGAPTFRVDPSWPTIPNDWVFGQTSGLAIDGQDRIWILQRPRTVRPEEAGREAPAVLEFDSEGSFVQGWGGPGAGYEWPNTEHGIFVDHNDYVWIAGSGEGDHQILKFTRDGRFVMQIGRAGRSQGNTDPSNVDRPADVYVYPATNELFVADGYGNRRVIVFDAETGAFKRMWGAFGNAPTDPQPADDPASHFNLVHGVRVSNDGLVYVSDRGGMRLQVFTVDGEYVTQLAMGTREADARVMAARANETAFGRPLPDLIREVGTAGQSTSRTAFSPDPEQRYLFVAERSGQQVVVLDRGTLERLAAFGRPGNAPGEFFILHDMVADARGNLYTAEVNEGRRAQKFTFMGLAPSGER